MQLFNIGCIYVVRFICLLCNLIYIRGDDPHAVQQRCDPLRIIERRFGVQYHLSQILRCCGVTRLRSALDLLPILYVEVDLLTVYLFEFSCHRISPFIFINNGSKIIILSIDNNHIK